VLQRRPSVLNPLEKLPLKLRACELSEGAREGHRKGMREQGKKVEE